MAEKAEALAATLEQSGWWEAALADGGIAAAEEMAEGFWRLCWTNDASFVTGGGTTGVGGRPLCTMLAHWQQFQAEKEPGAQTVEMVRNDNMGGTLKTAALKGDWALEESRLIEMYSRLEVRWTPPRPLADTLLDVNPTPHPCPPPSALHCPVRRRAREHE